MNKSTEITIRARAFAGQGVRTHQATIDTDGTIRVWDAIAGHYTLCHSLSLRTQANIHRSGRA